MSETVTCAKCMYTAKFPYTTGEMVKIFFDNHDCDSTKLQQAIERVRMLHVPNLRDGQEYCGTCVYPSIWDEWQVWPCKTIKALDGDQ